VSCQPRSPNWPGAHYIGGWPRDDVEVTEES
jgi:hypothetical protein